MLAHIAIVLSFLPLTTPDPLGARLTSATVLRDPQAAAVHYTATCSPAAIRCFSRFMPCPPCRTPCRG